MALGRLGVWYSTDKLNGSQLGDLVKAVEGNGYSALWYPESRGYESLSLAGFLLQNSRRLMIGSSIASIYARDAFTARRGLATPIHLALSHDEEVGCIGVHSLIEVLKDMPVKPKACIVGESAS